MFKMCLSNLEDETFSRSQKGRSVARCPKLCNMIVECLDNTSNFERQISTLGSPKKALSADILRKESELRPGSGRRCYASHGLHIGPQTVWKKVLNV